ncbi:MAG: hypothetical protein U1D00_28295 [Mycobacterium sp.]|nr:hypothetical protein [Mycobacterium sp.]
MAVRVHTYSDLLTMLDDLVHDMKSATEQFDQGRLVEATMLAVSIRKLVHQCDESDALINQLGLQGQLTWVDTAGVPNPKTMSSSACLTLMKVGSGTRRRAEYVPKLGLYPPAPIRTRDGGSIERGSRISFDHWWTNPVVKDCDGFVFSRKQLVLALARYGCETADEAETAAACESLRASGSLNWVVSGEKAWASTALESHPVMASVRQIAYEVLQTIRQQRDVIEGTLAA